MSIQPPPLLCQPWTGPISSRSSRPLSFPSLLHISFKQVLLEDSNLEQSNIAQGSIIAVVLRLMKMLDSAAFYTLSGNSPSIFLIHFWHSRYIPSTFEVHSRYFSCILFEFLDARTVFGSHSASILTAFVQHSRHLPARLSGVIRAAIELQSYGIRSAFWTFWQHSKYSYCVMTTFELHSRIES